ncbi:MAG: hypothetical protein NVS1B1_11850 [Candidatus Limnocylindrales bacterium]
MTVFVDTSGLYALLDAADAQHRRARTAFAQLVRSEDLLTHSYVLVETVALAHRRLGADAVRALTNDLLPAIATIWVDEAAHAAGLSALVAALPTDVSLVDQVSFHLMRQLQLTRAFAFDRDFQTAGFEVLP